MNSTSRVVKNIVGLSASVSDAPWDFHTAQRRTVVFENNARQPFYLVATERGLEFKRENTVVVLPIEELTKLLDLHAPELKNPAKIDVSGYQIT